MEESKNVVFTLKFSKDQILKVMRRGGMNDLSVDQLMEHVDEILSESAIDTIWNEIDYISKHRKEYDV